MRVMITISAPGDFRQWVGEDRHKIRNIVSANISGFSQVYGAFIDKLVDSNEQLMKVWKIQFLSWFVNVTFVLIQKSSPYIFMNLPPPFLAVCRNLESL